MAKNNLKKLAQQLLPVSKPPVPVNAIAKQLGIEVVHTDFKENLGLSGMLVRESDHTLMAINSVHSLARQRFTIAHEIGHFLLDDTQPIWVDKGVGPTQQISFRHDSNPAYAWEEVRANKFAAELLMPMEWVSEDFDVKNTEGVDWEEEYATHDLASKYQVSYQAMLIRLIELHLLARPRKP